LVLGSFLALLALALLSLDVTPGGGGLAPNNAPGSACQGSTRSAPRNIWMRRRRAFVVLCGEDKSWIDPEPELEDEMKT